MEKFENIQLEINQLITQYNQSAVSFFRDQLVYEIKKNTDEVVYATKGIDGDSIFDLYIDIGDTKVKVTAEFTCENQLEIRVPQIEIEMVGRDLYYLAHKISHEIDTFLHNINNP